MNTTSGFLVALLLLAAVLSSGAAREIDAELKKPAGSQSKGNSKDNSHKGDTGGGFGMPGGSFGIPGFGAGNGIPGFGGGNNGGWGNVGGGYGAGYGGPGGGYSKGGVVRPSVVCTEKGPCYKKKLTCPAKCFSSYSHSGKNGGGGGGGGGCTMDCKKKCVAYC